MSDAAATILVAGLVQIVVAICGVAVLWIKAQEAAVLAAAAKVAADVAAAKAVEAKTAAADAAAVGSRTEKTVDVIHTATNSDRARMELLIAAQNQQLTELRQKVETLHGEALAREQRLPPITGSQGSGGDL